MKKIEDILFITQGRLSSQRVKQKMIRPFCGTTLTDICLDKVKRSIAPIENCYFSAYEPELKRIGRKHGWQIYHRSLRSARSEGTPLTDIYEWYTLPYTYMIMVSSCNVLLKTETINKFIQHYIQSDHDGLFAVFEKKQFYWNKEGECITKLSDGEAIMNTKTVEPVYEAAHCLYASRLNMIGDNLFMGDFTKNNPELFVIDELEAFDIDYEWQFKLGEYLYKEMFL